MIRTKRFTTTFWRVILDRIINERRNYMYDMAMD